MTRLGGGFWKDKVFMRQLDSSLEQDVKRTSAFLKRVGINLFLNTGDSSGNARVLVEASSSSGVMTITFAHGYIQGRHLITRAPIYSDRMIVWTEEQLIDVVRGLDPCQEKRVAYVGFPKKYENTIADSGDVSALLLLGKIEKRVIADDHLREKLEKVILTLREFASKIVIRLHPSERIEIPSIEAWIDYWGLERSDLDLAQEISSAGIIVGASSSTLLEAASSGKIVYEIDELVPEGNTTEGSIRVSVAELQSQLEIVPAQKAPKQFSFDKKEISRKLTKLIFDISLEKNTNI